jgi:predicted double-glycine peptidase
MRRGGPAAPALALTLLICACGLSLPARGEIAVVAGGSTYGLGVMSWRDIPFRTVVRQQYDYSCGSAALATLLRYHYGRPVGEADVFKAMYAEGDQAKIRKVGFSLLDMKRYLEARGLHADGYRLDMAQLLHADRPAIAVMRIGPYRHFVVIKGISPGQILVGDPALGLKTYPLDAFKAQWDGIVFAIRDDGPVKGAFNQQAEWRPWSKAPLGLAMSDQSLADMTWRLPPVYQVAPTLDSVALVPLPGSR